MELERPAALPSTDIARKLCCAKPEGTDCNELVNLALQLAEVRAGLQQELDELQDEQLGLRAEHECLNESIGLSIAGARGALGRRLGRLPQETPAHWSEQAPPIDGKALLAGVLSGPSLGAQFSELWQQWGHHVTNRLSRGREAQHVAEAESKATTARSCPLAEVDHRQVARAALDQLYKRASRGSAGPAARPKAFGAGACGGGAAREQPRWDSASAWTSAPRMMSALPKLAEQWHAWGKQVNEQFSGHMTKSAKGLPLFEAAAEVKPRGKKPSKAKRAAEAKEPAAAAFSRVLLTAHIHLGGGKVAACDIHTNEDCREAVAGFAREHSLGERLQLLLRSRLTEALSTATRLPVLLEVDLQAIGHLIA